MVQSVAVNNHWSQMKVLLQSKATGLYLKSANATTASADEALDFMGSTQAAEFCAENKIRGMQIVLRFDEEHYNIVLPMLNGRSELAPRVQVA